MIRGGSRRVAKFLQESILIVFDFIWKILLSSRNFATLLDLPLMTLDVSKRLNNSPLQKQKTKNFEKNKSVMYIRILLVSFVASHYFRFQLVNATR